MISVTDIGTNTVKISFYSIIENNFKHIFSKSIKIGLGSYRKDNILSQKGIDALCEVLSDYTEISSALCNEMYYIATASLRGLDNLNDILSQVEKRCGVFIEIISGTEEASLGFYGLKESISPLNDGVFIDMGGGSTEIVLINNRKAEERVSLPMGALSLFNCYVSGIFPKEAEIACLKTDIDTVIKTKLEDMGSVNGRYAYITGGSAKAIGALITEINGKAHGNGAEFDREDFKSVYTKIMNKEEKFLHTAISKIPDRFYMLAPVLLFLDALFEHFSSEKIITVYSGIRDGFIVRRILNKI